MFEALEQFDQQAKLVMLVDEGHRIISIEGKTKVANELMALCEQMKTQ